MQLIDLNRQYKSYQTQIQNSINKVLEAGQYILGKELEELEVKLANYVNVDYVIGVSSGTTGLSLALEAVGVSSGDEVICVPYTWISPVEAVVRLGAKPVFVDIDPQTYLMDLSQIESLITPKTKVILPVSLYGQMPNFDFLNYLAQKYNLTIIEDAAQSFGAKQNSNKSCSVSHLAVTSFFPTKPLGCYGDGGAVFTNDEQLAKKIRALSVHGASKRYQHDYVGINGRLDTLQAAILNEKLHFFDREIEQRRVIASYYNENLPEIYSVPIVADGNTHVYAQYVLQSPDRATIQKYLLSHNIPSAVYYPICIHEQPAYRFLGYKQGDFPNAENVAKNVFSIPLHPYMTKEEIEQVVSVLNDSIIKIA